MLALVLVTSIANYKKVIHYDLGRVGDLNLVVDIYVEVHDQLPVNELFYNAHFYAKDRNKKLVDQKHVNIGQCFRKPNAFIVEDRFRAGYKQVFISLQYGGISSYLYAFKDRKFYTAFANDEARVRCRVLNSRRGTWRIEESDSYTHRTLNESAPNSRFDGHMVFSTWNITPRTEPILHVSTGDPNS